VKLVIPTAEPMLARLKPVPDAISPGHKLLLQKIYLAIAYTPASS
jgi:hypothetical protein